MPAPTIGLGNRLTTAEAGTGALINPPSNTIHQSTSHENACRYFILPEGGKVAETRVYQP